MFKRVMFGILPVILFFALALTVPMLMPNPWRPKVPTTLFALPDASGSITPEVRAAGRDVLAKFACGLVQGRDQLCTYLFDYEAVEGPSQIPTSRAEFTARLAASENEWLGDRKQVHRAKGSLLDTKQALGERMGPTRLGSALRLVCAEVKRLPPNWNIVIVSHWDGGFERPTETEIESFKQSIHELAGDRRISNIIIFGVKPTAITTVKAAFDSFGDRLKVFDLHSEVTP